MSCRKRKPTTSLRFCQQNPKPCPLLAVSEPGQYLLPTLGQQVDIRTDVPRYRVWQQGQLTDEPTDIASIWRDDLVTFIIGCSFSFEQALLEAGLPLRHLEQGRNVAMFRSSIATNAVGPFHGADGGLNAAVQASRPYVRSRLPRVFRGCTARRSRGFAASDWYP